MPQLTAPLDDILGSMSRVRLLRLLISEHRIVSARDAARLVGMSAPAILQAGEELVGLGLAIREEGGHQVRLRANPGHALFAPLRDLFAVEDTWAAMVFGSIQLGLAPEAGDSPSFWSMAPLGGPVVAACLFGSMARGDDQPGSDLDLLVLVRTPDDEDLVRGQIAEHAAEWRARFGMSVSPVVMSLDRARDRYAKADPLLIDAARDGRMITGAAPIAELLVGATAMPSSEPPT